MFMSVPSVTQYINPTIFRGQSTARDISEKIPGYDPLKVMIDEAHARGISFQAWVNPLRCYYEDDAPDVSTTYKNGSVV